MPINIEPVVNNLQVYTIKEITLNDINADKWLNQRKKIFYEMLNEGQIGHIILNEQNESIAYGWIAIGRAKPHHISKIPNGVAWLHYERVRDDYRGKGLGKLLIQERIRLIREKYKNIDIYTDTTEDNIPARVNQNKLGFFEAGVYSTIEIGTRKVPFLHILYGKWKEDKKHPELTKI